MNSLICQEKIAFHTKILHETRFYLAEGEGFEPPDSCPSPVFKTGAIDHSANLPYDFYYDFRKSASL